MGWLGLSASCYYYMQFAEEVHQLEHFVKKCKFFL
jgi:hypothetical protein